MSENHRPRTVTVRIQRYNPDMDSKPYLQDYEVAMDPDTTVLDTRYWLLDSVNQIIKIEYQVSRIEYHFPGAPFNF